MISRMMLGELKMMAPWVLLFDAVAYIVSLPFMGINYSMALGLLLGTVVLSANLIILGNAAETALNHKERSAKFHMAGSYVLRCLIAAAAIGLSFKFSFVLNPIGTAVPLFYPKLIYILNSLINRERRSKNE